MLLGISGLQQAVVLYSFLEAAILMAKDKLKTYAPLNSGARLLIKALTPS